jgi:hypothetical protein
MFVDSTMNYPVSSNGDWIIHERSLLPILVHRDFGRRFHFCKTNEDTAGDIVAEALKAHLTACDKFV